MSKREKSIVLYSNAGYRFFATEVLFISTVLSIIAAYYFKYHWAIGILTTLFLVASLLALFENVKIVRYLMIGFLIFFWGLLGYLIGVAFEKSPTSVLGIVLGIVFALVALFTHISAFEWMSNVDDKR